MTKPLVANPKMTIQDWLEYPGAEGERFEFIDGELIAMNAPKSFHGAIAGTLGALINASLKGKRPCRAIHQAGVIVEKGDLSKGYIPDLVVTCEPFGDNPAVVSEPRIIVEITSESTRGYETHDKVPDYFELPSVEEVWLLSSLRRYATVWRRDGETWSSVVAIGRGEFASQSLGQTFALDDIYEVTSL